MTWSHLHRLYKSSPSLLQQVVLGMGKDLGPRRPQNLVSRRPPRARGPSFLLPEPLACAAAEEGQGTPWRGRRGSSQSLDASG